MTVAHVFAPRLLLLYGYIVSAVFVDFRGKIRHRFTRQLTDHSTIMAPLNRAFAFVYPLRSVGKRLKAKSQFACHAVKYAMLGGLFYRIFLK